MRNLAPLPPALARFAVDGRKTKGTVLTSLDCFDAVLPPAKTLVIPFNFDSEYVDNLARVGPLDGEILEGRSGVTVQIRGIAEPTGTIFAASDQAKLAEATGRTLRHPVVQHPTVVIDWLQLRGVDCSVIDDPVLFKSLRKTCRLQVCAHFALADIAFLAGTSPFLESIVDLFKTRKLSMGRRLLARASGHARAKSGTTLLAPWVIRFGEHYYRLALEIVDTAGLHGIAGYGTLAKNVGVHLEAKDVITRQGPGADITRMDEVYFEKPEDFDAYALGDLFVSDIIFANENLWGSIWTALGIASRKVPPRLTIGGTVADLLKNRIAEAVGATLADDDDITAFTDATTGTHNAGTLAKFARSKNPVALLAKVDGGRCRNSKPTLTSLTGTLADIDIGGAYAAAMTAAPLVFGQVRTSFDGNARDLAGDLRPCQTLADWLRCHENRLVDRAWYARISTREPFSFETDLIPSWVGYRVTAAMSDSEIQGLDILMDSASGEMRYFGREIWSGTLTSDLLEVARTTMSTRQFDEWSAKIVVRSAVYVDKKDFVTVEEYRRLYKKKQLGEFTWTSMTLGELVSDVARANRKQVQQNFGKGTPLDILYKLVSNTLYGDSVSRFFGTSSVISGSNVTGSVRAFMFLAEKGLNLVGSITDGQLFDLNRVLHSRDIIDPRFPTYQRKPGDIAIGVRAYLLSGTELSRTGKSRIGPLVGKKLETRWTGETLELEITHIDGEKEIVVGEHAVKTWVDNAAYEHLCRLWPACKLLKENFGVVDGLNSDGSVRYLEQKGLFRFETKEMVSRAAFHGSANYLHVPTIPTSETKIRMRSFEADREHLAFTLDSLGVLAYVDTYVNRSPADALLQAIETDPRRVPILPPFTKTRILKPGIYTPKPVEGRTSNSRFHSDGVIVIPGDSVFVLGRPRLFSLAQFTFQNRQQYENWRRTTSRLINRDGLSFEQWFMNSDGLTVDFVAMVEAVDRAINLGIADPIRYFDSIYRRRLDAVIKDFHRASKMMAEHLKLRLGADETGYIDYDPSDDFAGFAGVEFSS